MSDRRRNRFDPQFIIILACIMGAAVAIATMLLPVRALGAFSVGSGLAALVPAAAPPIGSGTRALMALGLGLLAMAIAGGILVVLGRIFAPETLTRMRTGNRIVAGETGEEAPPPRLRRADAHADAPPRRPIFASSDLGDPIEPFAPEQPAPSAEEEPLDLGGMTQIDRGAEVQHWRDWESPIASTPIEEAEWSDVPTPNGEIVDSPESQPEAEAEPESDPTPAPADPVMPWPLADSWTPEQEPEVAPAEEEEALPEEVVADFPKPDDIRSRFAEVEEVEASSEENFPRMLRATPLPTLEREEPASFPTDEATRWEGLRSGPTFAAPVVADPEADEPVEEDPAPVYGEPERQERLRTLSGLSVPDLVDRLEQGLERRAERRARGEGTQSDGADQALYAALDTLRRISR